jgi:hypothetical protein
MTGTFQRLVTTVASASPQASIGLLFAGAGTLDDSTRLILMRDLFAFYRVMRLKVSFLNSQSGATEPGWAAFNPGDENNAPTTLAQAAELDKFAMAMPGQTVPSHLNVARKDLEGPTPWYECSGGASGVFPGRIYVGAYGAATGLATADVLQVLVEYDIEFKERAQPSVEMVRRLAHSLEERDPEPVLVVHPNSKHFGCHSSECKSCASGYTTPRG